MANLEGMPIGSLPELTGDLQDEDEVVVYRPSTGKAYQANTDLIDSFAANEYKEIPAGDSYTYKHTSNNFSIIFFNYSAEIYGMAMCRASRVVWIYQPSGAYVSITMGSGNATITNNLNGVLPTYIINV